MLAFGGSNPPVPAIFFCTLSQMDIPMTDMMLFSGNATPELANSIASYLELDLSDATISRFSDGEINVEINENVRGQDVFIIQSTCTPTNENLME